MSRLRIVAQIFLTALLVVGAFSYKIASAKTLPPVRIIIPTAKVNTTVIPVGVTPKGNLDTPPNFVQAGWYKNGVVPGQIGSAVIDGHVDNGANIPGPFKHLKDVKIGDVIDITNTSGQILHFSVSRIDAYKNEDFPSQSIFNDYSGPLLKIITCHGKFVASKKTYDQRLVVTAVLRSSNNLSTISSTSLSYR